MKAGRIDRAVLAARLREHRRRRGWTLERLAAESGASRHGAVTMMRRAGMRAEAAQRVIGHRDLRTTLATYSEVGDEAADEAAAAVAEYLRPVPKAEADTG